MKIIKIEYIEGIFADKYKHLSSLAYSNTCNNHTVWDKYEECVFQISHPLLLIVTKYVDYTSLSPDEDVHLTSKHFAV